MSNQSPTANGPGQFPDPPIGETDGLPDDRAPGKNRPLGEIGRQDGEAAARQRQEIGNREDTPGAGQGA